MKDIPKMNNSLHGINSRWDTGEEKTVNLKHQKRNYSKRRREFFSKRHMSCYANQGIKPGLLTNRDTFMCSSIFLNECKAGNLLYFSR